MKQPTDKRPKTPADIKAERLNAALRDNLRRRKAAETQTELPIARRAPGAQSPSSSEAVEQEKSPHEKETPSDT